MAGQGRARHGKDGQGEVFIKDERSMRRIQFDERKLEEEIAYSRLERPDRRILSKGKVKELNEGLNRLMNRVPVSHHLGKLNGA